MPIISLNACHAWFIGDSNISGKVICTRDPHNLVKRGDGDSGGPVVNQHGQLLGISSYSREVKNYQLPDVSINVVHPLYKVWIVEHIEQSKTVYNIHTYHNRHHTP